MPSTSKTKGNHHFLWCLKKKWFFKKKDSSKKKKGSSRKQNMVLPLFAGTSKAQARTCSTTTNSNFQIEIGAREIFKTKWFFGEGKIKIVSNFQNYCGA